MNEQYVAIYSDEYSDYVAAGPFNTADEATAYLEKLVRNNELREKDCVAVAKLKKLTNG